MTSRPVPLLCTCLVLKVNMIPLLKGLSLHPVGITLGKACYAHETPFVMNYITTWDRKRAVLVCVMSLWWTEITSHHWCTVCVIPGAKYVSSNILKSVQCSLLCTDNVHSCIVGGFCGYVPTGCMVPSLNALISCMTAQRLNIRFLICVSWWFLDCHVSVKRC